MTSRKNSHKSHVMKRSIMGMLLILLSLGLLSCKQETNVIIVKKLDPDVNWVFTGNTDGYAAYRCPTLTISKTGTILAFCEGRVDSEADEGDIDFVLKRSLDEGKTWLPLQVIENDGKNPCKNICPVVLDNGRILALWLWNEYIGNEALRTTRDVYVTYSDDDGVTWATSKNISSQVYRNNWGWYGLGPVHAIVKQRDPNKGRIIVPARHELLGGKTHSHLIYSDDNGETWTIGAISLRNQTTEATVVELSNGDLMLNSRNALKEDNKRYVNISKDGGLTFSHSYLDAYLPFAGACQASIIYHSVNTKTGKYNILFSGPNHHTERVQGTVFLSNDDGVSWNKKFMYSKPFPVFSGYSDLIVFNDEDIGVLYETGSHYDKKFRYDGVGFKRFKFSDLK
jgi:sialidase-1